MSKFDDLERDEVRRLSEWLCLTDNAPKLGETPDFVDANQQALLAVLHDDDTESLKVRFLDIATKHGFCPRCDGVDDGDFAIGQECGVCGRTPRPSKVQIADANADDDRDRMIARREDRS